MRQFLFKIIFLPLDLAFLTVDSCIISWRVLIRLLKKQKVQKCHLCQGESNQEENHPVRAVLKYQNKWMVRLLAPCIRFQQDEKRKLGFCKLAGYMTLPPAWVPILAMGMISFWVLSAYGLLKGFSSDPDNFAKNFISTFIPSTLGEDDVDPDFLNPTGVQLNPARAERYFLSGLKFFDKMNYPAAQVDFKIAIQSNPTDAKLHFHLAKSLLAMGQLVQGENSIRKTLEYDPEHVEALLVLAELMERRENWDEALKLAAKALELEPEDQQAVRLNAGLLAATGEKEKTRAMMDQLLAMDPESVDTLTFLGRLELSVFQNVAVARTRLDAALAIDPNYNPALLAMIPIYASDNSLENIESTIAKVLELDPENLQALRMEADMILNRYGLSAGVRAYQRLLNRFGGDIGLRLRYAELLLRSGKISEGKKLAQQITASRIPQFERASHWMLAQMYSQVRMHEEAVHHARSTQRLTPQSQNIHLFLAQQLMALGDIGEARREAELALAQNRQDTRAVNLLTQSLVMQKRTEEAVTLLDTLIQEFPEQDAFRMRRIEILMQSERWREALTDTRMLKEKYPDNSALKNNLAFLLARSGQELDVAEALSVQLAEEFPENPIIMDTRAYVMAAQGQHEPALKIYEQALSRAGENVVIRFHYAKSLLALQRAQDAKAQLEALLMINPEFPQVGEARALLGSLSGGEG
ncbi:MAG: tetratricopeptide repeat protein [Kiritimatiellia bacterium]